MCAFASIPETPTIHPDLHQSISRLLGGYHAVQIKPTSEGRGTAHPGHAHSRI